MGESSATYKVGDKVLIVEDRTEYMSRYGGMDKYLGTEMTISDIRERPMENTYAMKEDGGLWVWDDNMIERKVSLGLSDLCTGMLVTIKRGDTFMVMRDVVTSSGGREDIVIKSNGAYMFLSNYNEDMTDKGIRAYDIMKVYRAPSVDFLMSELKQEVHDLIYERPAVKMTLKEVERELGYEVDIVD